MKLHLTKEQQKGLKQQQAILKNNKPYHCEECGKVVHITKEESDSFCSSCLMKGKIGKLTLIQKKKIPKKRTNTSGKVVVHNLPIEND